MIVVYIVVGLILVALGLTSWLRGSREWGKLLCLCGAASLVLAGITDMVNYYGQLEPWLVPWYPWVAPIVFVYIFGAILLKALEKTV